MRLLRKRRCTNWGRTSSARGAERRGVGDTIWRSFLVGLFLLTAVDAASAEAIAFRGIPLGIDLEDFRKTPFPDAAKYPGSKVICSGDKEAAKFYETERPQTSPAQARIGVTACNYYSIMRSPGVPPQTFRNGPDLANIGGYETTFFFTPATFEPAKRRRLYLVTVKPKSDHFDTITAAIKERYGEPTGIDRSEFQTRGGAAFPNETQHWNVDGVTIFVTRFNNMVGQALVAYTTNDLADAVGASIKNLAKENAQKL